MKKLFFTLCLSIITTLCFAQPVSPALRIVNNTGCFVQVVIQAHEGFGSWSAPLALGSNGYTMAPFSSNNFLDLNDINFAAFHPDWLWMPGNTYTVTSLGGDWDRISYFFPSTSSFGFCTNGSGTTSTGSTCGLGTVTWGPTPIGWSVTFD